MTTTKHEIRAGAYFDSVVLMQLQKALAGLSGVLDAGVVMATPANRELLEASDFSLTGIDARADDLLIMVRAEDEEAADAALAQVDDLLRRRRSSATQAFRPRSLQSAVQALPDAGWVLISVPGRYAAAVADEALELERNIFLYSDNVALEDEIRLKEKAQEKRLLVMGPDCGTAIINGVGLGFANRVRRGGVGIVAASGTGLQAVAAGVHNRGAGISQAIGTGGRDLKREVGGTTALQGLKLLADDPHTEVIVIVSKPPAADVAERLLGAAQAAGKPVVVHFIGYPPPARSLNNLHFALSLEDAAVLATELTSAPPNTLSGSRVAPPPTTATADHVGPRYLRGLFSGGTLAYEALLGLQPFLAPLYSNVPIRPEQRLEDSLSSQAHTVLDLGEDEFTQGRLHPMMDNDLRLRRLREEADDPEVSVILIDVVLGEGAHPDPASELALAIARVREARDDLTVAAVVVGTDEDPQGLDEQIAQLAEAGVEIFSTTTEAVAAIVPRLTKARPETEQAELQFGESLSAINVGVESFYDSLRAQGAEAVQVEWRPPAGGNEKLMAILARMKSK